MKKMEVDKLKNIPIREKEMFEDMFNFLKKLDLETISKFFVTPDKFGKQNQTYFLFKTKKGHAVEFYYKKNQKVHNIRLWKEEVYLGKISLKENDENEKDEKREKWLNSIWEQFVDHFNLRIRLLFISETTPWNWNTEFIY